MTTQIAVTLILCGNEAKKAKENAIKLIEYFNKFVE